MKKITAAITGVGAYLPDYLLTNDELSRMVDTSDEWIMTRIGIKTRHILKGEGLGTSYMGARAIKDLLEKTGVNPLEIDIVICATVTPDMFFPSTGNLIADQAGCKNAFAYDISAACSGNVVGESVFTTGLVGDQIARRGEKHIRGNRGADHDVDLQRINPGFFQQVFDGACAHIRCTQPLSLEDMAGFDADACHDPLVGSVHHSA